MTNEARAIVEAATALTKGIVSKPEKATFKSKQLGEVLGLELSVMPEDMPRMIGRAGVHAATIKQLFHLAGQAKGLRVTVNIFSQGPKVELPKRDFIRNPNWNSEQVRDITEKLAACFLSEPFAIEAVDLEEITLLQINPHFSEMEAIPSKAMDSMIKLLDAIGKANGRVVELARLASTKDNNDESIQRNDSAPSR